jgi:NitT/TauT family transport system ATP-binding protein
MKGVMPVTSTDSSPAAVKSLLPATPAIEFRDVVQEYPTRQGSFRALDTVNLTIQPGEFVSVVGPSGGGKSTLVGLVSSLLKPTTGTVELFGAPVKGVNRDVGLMFQGDVLLPWATVLSNVTLPLRIRGASSADAKQIGREWLARVGLEKFAKSYPHQLSGGMRKRVSLATVLSFEPRVLLMDEPFSSLDMQTRLLMEADLLELWSGGNQTVVFITHDLEEAVSLSDRVIVMSTSPGTIVGDYGVTLPRPRNLLEVRFEPDFVEIHHTIWEQLRGEVLKASNREAT